jgi:outer membrane protein
MRRKPPDTCAASAPKKADDMKKRFRKAAIAAVLALASLDASAQVFPEIDTMPAVIGLGVGVLPDYKGSDDKTGGIAPFARYTFSGSERYLQLNTTELSLNVLNNRSFRFGPVLNYHFGRDDSVDDPLVSRMVKLDGTVEAGVFGEIVWTQGGNPRNRFILGATLLWDVGGEADGFRGRLNARYWHQVSQAIDLHIGAGLIYGDSKYNNHYFGVNAGNVGASGLPFFNAGSGVNEYFLTLGGVMYFNRNWFGAAGARISQISGDPKDSPIVSQQGDKSQFIGGLGVGYMFR